MTYIEKIKVPDILPILVTDNAPIFPHCVANMRLDTENNITLINDAVGAGMVLIGVIMIGADKGQIHEIGCSALIDSVVTNQGSMNVLLGGFQRIRLEEIIQQSPYLKARVSVPAEETIAIITDETEKLIGELKEKVVELGKLKLLTPGLAGMILSIKEPGKLTDLCAFHCLGGKQAQDILIILNEEARLRKAISCIDDALKGLSPDIAQPQKAAAGPRAKKDQAAIHREKIEKAGMPPEIKQETLETLQEFSQLNPIDGNYSYLNKWLQVMEDLPWDKGTQDQIDIAQAEAVLEQDHYGLEEVKRRIIECLAIKKLKPQGKSPILCFIGPPGTGKTSIGKSIAQAMGRKFISMSLGGVSDETQIKGHRRTYVGALPGMIIDHIRRAGSNNPVFMIDEIDKIGSAAHRGNPALALLEALDPEQNSKFTDHYLAVPFDLSKVMFICTGNIREQIHPALLDRMEVIDFSGYTKEEKLKIAKRYLIPRQTENNGLTAEQIIFQDQTVLSVIECYTTEGGVRNLEREIGKICRRTAVKVATGEISQAVITERETAEILGPKRYLPQSQKRIDKPGIAIGLAVTPSGGEILLIETEVIKDNGRPCLKITGNIGKTMQESAELALTFIAANLKMLGLRQSPLKYKVFIHVPEAATPKDGSSAGLAIFAALASRLTNKKIRDDVAMTGEITMRGAVTAVGGIREKVLAAREAGVKIIILPKENAKDLPALPPSIEKAVEEKELEIKLVSEIREVVEIIFNQAKG